MLLADAELEDFWQAATSKVPILIIGGGRWGKTWCIAASRARGSGAAITIAARTDPAATRVWASGNDEVAGLRVVGSVAEALEQTEAPMLAIIASRPSNHLRDGIEAINCGLDILVEKPMGDSAQAGAELLALARLRKRQLAVGTEFAFLPAFHASARAFTNEEKSAQKIRLYWGDPILEIRHGDVKRQHEETSMLFDLFPHAYSIFRIFSSGAKLKLEALNEDAYQRGYLHIRDELGGTYEVHCDRLAESRQRVLEIETPRLTASVNFATEPPTVSICGVTSENIATRHMRSTLRLTLGAFLLQRLRPNRAILIDADLDQLIRLQAEIEGKLIS